MAHTAIKSHKLMVQKGGQVILPSLDIDVRAGSITGLIGPSGSGKTTLMRAMVGVQRYQGELTVLDMPAGTAVLRSKIGYVTQRPAIYDDLTVRQNIAYFAAMIGQKKSSDTVINQVQLTKYTDQLAGSLSGGQRARVSLAVALLGSPDVLILDEPTVGLDPLLRNDLWALFRAFVESGKTVLVSSHVMDEAERCDDIILLREGSVLWNDSRKGLLEKAHAKTVGVAFETMIREDA